MQEIETEEHPSFETYRYIWDLNKELDTVENPGYYPSLALLIDYAKTLPQCCPTFFSDIVLAITLHCDRHHVAAVRKTTLDHLYPTEPKEKTVRSLFTDLKNNLIKAGIEVSPTDSLGRRIWLMVHETGVVISINEINGTIQENRKNIQNSDSETSSMNNS